MEVYVTTLYHKLKRRIIQNRKYKALTNGLETENGCQGQAKLKLRSQSKIKLQKEIIWHLLNRRAIQASFDGSHNQSFKKYLHQGAEKMNYEKY